MLMPHLLIRMPEQGSASGKKKMADYEFLNTENRTLPQYSPGCLACDIMNGWE